jgi:hypothetical protein
VEGKFIADPGNLAKKVLVNSDTALEIVLKLCKNKPLGGAGVPYGNV